MIKPVTKTSWQVMEGENTLGYVRQLVTGQYMAVVAVQGISKYDTLDEAVEAVRDRVLTRFKMIEVD